MSLKTYKKKRKFSSTPEPEAIGGKKINAFRFYVQKHDASRLHYDFRLEVDGVLKSWAVPKGPSMDPEQKRLAIQVEDHPIEYGDFEGIIPEGNYGAGTVMVWDKGTYEIPDEYLEGDTPGKCVTRMLKNGDIKLRLHGRKLRGLFTFVKLKKSSKNEWLLLKKKDQYSISGEDILENDHSVMSNYQLDDIERKASDKRTDSTISLLKIDAFPTKKKPSEPVPMNAYLVEGPFDHPDWLFELKFDGYRSVALVDKNGKTELLSRNGESFNKVYEVVRKEIASLKRDLILDGEIVILDQKGVSDFQLLQKYEHTNEGILLYYIFDLLYIDGRDITSAPLEERKLLLKGVLDKPFDHLRYSDHVREHGKYLFEETRKLSMEGVIAKKADSRYVYGIRSHDWLKIKHVKRQEVVIAGFTEPGGSRSRFGALVLAVRKDGHWQHIGAVGTGFDEYTLEKVYKKLKPLIQPESPLEEDIKSPKKIVWVKPELVCEIKFREWTSAYKVRQAVFLGLREDKPAEKVRREVPDKKKGEKRKAESEMTNRTPVRRDSIYNKKEDPGTIHRNLINEKVLENTNEVQCTVNGIDLSFTNLDKKFWPEKGIRKLDVINYYSRVADFILPYLKDRPQSLKRNPEGIKKKGFFQKNMPSSIPDWLRTVSVESEEKTINYLLCNDRQTLLFMANWGCIEINPWNSQVASKDKPTYLVIDLDPNEIGFDKIVHVALKVREVLDVAGIPGYPKTSGASGMHVYVPLGGLYTYDQARNFAEIIVNYTRRICPEYTSLERSPSKRKNKVYLDYLQNRRAQTVAAPYCLRPVEEATVATPLFWDELIPDKLRPTMFTTRTILKRLERYGDIFKPVLTDKIDMADALKKLSEHYENG